MEDRYPLALCPLGRRESVHYRELCCVSGEFGWGALLDFVNQDRLVHRIPEDKHEVAFGAEPQLRAFIRRGEDLRGGGDDPAGWQIPPAKPMFEDFCGVAGAEVQAGLLRSDVASEPLRVCR